jgi:TrmH family RNA methyltransferase
MIEKASKNRLKQVQLLLREKKERDSSGLFVAEGFKIVKDMSARGHVPEYILVCKDFADNSEKNGFVAWCSKERIPIGEVEKKEFEKISALQSSQGILAVMAKRKYASLDFLETGRKLIILCDGVQDPGNMGSIFRTAVAFGADAIMFSADTVDMYNPKVVRSSSGTILDIPVIEYRDAVLERLKAKGYKLLVSMVETEAGTKEIRKMKEIPTRTIAAFGSEGRGMSDELLSSADGYFHVGISKKVESLNVTVAVAVSLFVFGGLSAA